MSRKVKTEAEFKGAGEGLMAWADQTAGVLAFAAMLASDEDSGSMASTPAAFFAGSLEGLTETDIAALLAQIHVAVLLFVSRFAGDSKMGADAFRRVFDTARTQMAGGGDTQL